MASLEVVSKIVWKQCLRPKPDENALIIADPSGERLQIARTLLETGKWLCKCKLMTMKPTGMHGREPTATAAKAMLGADIVLAPLEYSITHTKATANALKNGARIATMPGITKDIFLRAVPVDYGKMGEVCNRLKALLEKAKKVRVTSKAGTDITMKTAKGRKVSVDNGLIDRPSKLNNLPAGEVAIAPEEGSSNGIIVFDISALDIKLKKPFGVLVRNGLAVKCENKKLWKILISAKNGTNLAELGIGINPKARITGNMLEDEKAKDTAHIAFGTNADLGGRIQTSVHLDSVLHRPTIEVNGNVIIREGRFLF